MWLVDKVRTWFETKPEDCWDCKEEQRQIRERQDNILRGRRLPVIGNSVPYDRKRCPKHKR